MDKKKSVLTTSILIFVFGLVELAGGKYSGSLVLLSDSGHMFLDLCPLVGAYFSLSIAEWGKNKNYTFGYVNIEPIMGLISGVTLSIFLVFEIGINAFWRLLGGDGGEVPDVGIIFMIGLLGFVINYVVSSFLHKHKADSLAIKGAFLHNRSDMFLSGAVMISAGLTYLTGLFFLDPVISLGVAGYLLGFPVRKLIGETIKILLAGVPHGLDVEEVTRKIKKIKNVRGVPDIHLWGEDRFKAAIIQIHIRPKIRYKFALRAKHQIEEVLQSFGVRHITVALDDRLNQGEKCVHC